MEAPASPRRRSSSGPPVELGGGAGQRPPCDPARGRERPGPDELIDQGELDELVPQAQFIELRALTVRLRELRQRMGLSLTDLSERTGLTRAAISRLENGWNLNPTLETLWRYAAAVGKRLAWQLEDVPDTRPRRGAKART